MQFPFRIVDFSLVQFVCCGVVPHTKQSVESVGSVIIVDFPDTLREGSSSGYYHVLIKQTCDGRKRRRQAEEGLVYKIERLPGFESRGSPKGGCFP